MAGLLLKSFYLFPSSQWQGKKENKLKTFKLFCELVKGTGFVQWNDTKSWHALIYLINHHYSLGTLILSKMARKWFNRGEELKI